MTLARRSDTRFVQFIAVPFAAALQGTSASRLFDEDPTHRLGSGGEEVSAAIPALRLVRVHQTQIRFMNERRGLQRLTGLFLREPPGRELSKLLVDERQELFGTGLPSYTATSTFDGLRSRWMIPFWCACW